MDVHPSELTEKENQERRESFMTRVDNWLENDFGIGALGKTVMHNWIDKMAMSPLGLEHLRDWLLRQVSPSLKRNKEVFSPWQIGCPDLIPGLTPRAVWHLPNVVALIESRAPSLIQELENSKNKQVFQPYRAPNWVNPDRIAQDGMGSLGHDSGEWNVCYLYLHNVNFSQNCELFPEAVSLIKSLPRWYCHAFISVLDPSTHISKHHGPTNKKLRIHLPLQVPPGGLSGIRVGDETISFELGKCVVFDDSFEHEAWNHHKSQSRICLIMDIWHPELSDREVTVLKFLEKGKMKLAKSLCESSSQFIDSDWKNEQGDNFYKILEHTSGLKNSLDQHQ